MNVLLLLICVTQSNAQNTLHAFLSKSVVMEGDPVTIICGIRHFESPSTRLLCTEIVALRKMNYTTGEFITLLSYGNHLRAADQEWINFQTEDMVKDWNIQMKGFPEVYDLDFNECQNEGLLDANITVKIAKVKIEDAGTYMCAVHQFRDNAYKTLEYSHCTNINLTVKSPSQDGNTTEKWQDWNSSRISETRKALVLINTLCVFISVLIIGFISVEHFQFMMFN